MAKAKGKWMTLAELAFIVLRDRIPGFPVSDSGMLQFVRAHKIDDDPDLVSRNPEGEGGWLYNARILDIYRRDDVNDGFSSGEAIKARLPSLPKNSASFSTFVQKVKWREVPKKARKRQGSGGGWEYHVSLLPPADQRVWRDYMAKRDAAEVEDEGQRSFHCCRPAHQRPCRSRKKTRNRPLRNRPRRLTCRAFETLR